MTARWVAGLALLGAFIPLAPAAGSGIGDGGPATSAVLVRPNDVAVDANGNLFIADSGDNRVRRVDRSTGIIETVAGTGAAEETGDGGPATEAGVMPDGVFVDGRGDLYIAAWRRVRKVDHATGIITTVAGGGELTPDHGDGGPAVGAFLGPSDVVVDPIGDLYISDGTIPLPDPPYWDARVRKVDARTGIITTVYRDVTNPTFLSVDALGRVLVTNMGFHDCCTYSYIDRIGPGGVYRERLTGGACPPCATDPYQYPLTRLWVPLWDDLTGTAVGPVGTIHLGWGRQAVGPTAVLSILAENLIVPLAGRADAAGCAGDHGPAVEALIGRVGGLAVDPEGDVYAADPQNENVRRIAADGTISTVAGTPCP